MDIGEILKRCDHTLLAQTATWDQIKAIIDDGMRFGTASVCIPPSFVKRAAEYAGGRLRICTVIGFPNGYSTTSVKLFETAQALSDGADEIDMVINIGELKAGNSAYVSSEIRALKALCGGRILKVIVETCFLTEEEKLEVCRIVTESGADYIKTSTGFGGGGATHEDVRLFRDNIGPGVRIKAAGGISGMEDAAEFIEDGADRLGTSRIVKLAKEKIC